jgi:hypothetical protein
MKLRFRDNSVRLRLTRSEVDTLRQEGLVSSKIEFPGSREFNYVVESSPASVNPGAFLSDNVLTVRLPETTVLGWAASEQVTIDGEQLLDDGQRLSILVEKDFACLVPREDEDDAEMFENPDAS